jgi:hypothetical protein
MWLSGDYETIIKCANCGYETDEVSELDYCQTCQRAYDLGKSAGNDDN